jgi:glutathione S-transferase
MATLTLYDAPRCPFCARTRITLAEKGIEYETVEIDLADRPDWIYDKNPKGRVPVLEIGLNGGSWPLPESAVIGEYLEERFPDPALWPADAEERAAARLLVFRFDDFSQPYYALRRGETGARERFDPQLAALDALLQQSDWLSGGAFGLADIAYLPWIVRARDLLDVPLDELPRLAEWLARASERPPVAAELAVVAAL